MRICILICGLRRTVDLVIKKFNEILGNNEVNYILSLNYENIDFDDPNIIKKIFLRNVSDDKFRNSLNYSYKLCNGIKLIPDNYDLYIISRSDLIIDNIDINEIEENNYFLKKNINQFTKDISDKINDGLIISKNYNFIKKLSNIYEYNLKNINYFDIVLFNFIKDNGYDYKLLNINYKLILYKCNVIAIAGDSGSGKSTLLKILQPLFNKESILMLETDRYHKWERGDSNYESYTHLNPYANHLEKMYEDVYDLKIGTEIYQVDYDHQTGKFTQKEKIESKKNIIICGLHTIYDDKIKELIDLKIYIDTERELIKKWKIQRDVNERNHSIEKVLKQIENREKDYNEYILIQKEYADMIINFFEVDNNLKCKLILKNKNLINKIIKHILDYKICYENDILVIYLNNNFETNDPFMNYIFNSNETFKKNNYFKEIFYIINKLYI